MRALAFFYNNIFARPGAPSFVRMRRALSARHAQVPELFRSHRRNMGVDIGTIRPDNWWKQPRSARSWSRLPSRSPIGSINGERLRHDEQSWDKDDRE
jgi:hypothetical protein